MDMALTILKYLGAGFGALFLVAFGIYWFELDTKFLRWFEPTFHKLVRK